jgi:hypothetical protein
LAPSFVVGLAPLRIQTLYLASESALDTRSGILERRLLAFEAIECPREILHDEDAVV